MTMRVEWQCAEDIAGLMRRQHCWLGSAHGVGWSLAASEHCPRLSGHAAPVLWHQCALLDVTMHSLLA